MRRSGARRFRLGRLTTFQSDWLLLATDVVEELGLGAGLNFAQGGLGFCTLTVGCFGGGTTTDCTLLVEDEAWLSFGLFIGGLREAEGMGADCDAREFGLIDSCVTFEIPTGGLGT